MVSINVNHMVSINLLLTQNMLKTNQLHSHFINFWQHLSQIEISALILNQQSFLFIKYYVLFVVNHHLSNSPLILLYMYRVCYVLFSNYGSLHLLIIHVCCLMFMLHGCRSCSKSDIDKMAKANDHQVFFKNVSKYYNFGSEIQCSYSIDSLMPMSSRDRVCLFNQLSGYPCYQWSPMLQDHVNENEVRNKWVIFPGELHMKIDITLPSIKGCMTQLKSQS